MNRAGARIVYVGPFDFPRRNAASQLVDATASALASAGHHVSIVARASDEISLGTEFELSHGVFAKLATRTSRPASLFEAWRTVRAVSSVLRMRDVETIIVYNSPCATLLLVMLLGRIRRVPVVGHCTEWYVAPPLRPRLVRSLMKRMDTALRMRVLHRLMAGLIVSSDYLKTYYRGKRTIVVPTLTPPVARLNTPHGPSEPRVLVYAGTPFELGPRKIPPERMKDRLDLAIDWLAAIKDEGLDFRFDIFGVTLDQYLIAVPQQRTLIERMGESIRFRGRVQNDLAANAVVAADFTVLVRDVSRTTLAGFPTKVTESLMAGTPPIASAVGDTPRYVEHEVTGFLLPPDREAGIAVLRKALTMSSSQCAAMKARTAASRTLEPTAWGLRIAEFLTECAGGAVAT